MSLADLTARFAPGAGAAAKAVRNRGADPIEEIDAKIADAKQRRAKLVADRDDLIEASSDMDDPALAKRLDKLEAEIAQVDVELQRLAVAQRKAGDDAQARRMDALRAERAARTARVLQAADDWRGTAAEVDKAIDALVAAVVVFGAASNDMFVRVRSQEFRDVAGLAVQVVGRVVDHRLHVAGVGGAYRKIIPLGPDQRRLVDWIPGPAMIERVYVPAPPLDEVD